MKPKKIAFCVNDSYNLCGVCMSLEFNFSYKKKAVVIGGTSSLGFLVAKGLVSHGAEVFVLGRSFPYKDSTSEGRKMNFLRCDFEKDGIEVLERDDIRKELLTCDILVVAYGPFVQKTLDQTKVDDWKNIALFDYALPGFALSIALSGMQERSCGSILLFGGSRTEQIRGRVRTAAYHGAKTGLAVLAESVAKSYAQKGIACNVILPGLSDNVPAGMEAYAIDGAKIAEAALFLIENRNLNGIMLPVDKGWIPK